MNLLEVKGLNVIFSHGRTPVKAVSGVDFEIRQNEVLGLLGASGSGKTVTALAVMGLVPRHARAKGQVFFQGKNIFGLDERSMQGIRGVKIAFIPQEPFTSLNPVMRIGRQIAEMFTAHARFSRKSSCEKAKELLERVGLGNDERIFLSFPHQLSGGQRQRALIAMALAMKPKLLIADEPTTALDATVQKEILKLLLDIKREMGLSILFITHDFALINEAADRIIVMKDGRIVEEGAKEDVFNHPKNDYTVKLIEAVPRPGFFKGGAYEEGETLIEARGLSKSFSIQKGIFRKGVKGITAVKEVSLKIQKGKTLGLVGESGCGKTTLGRMLLNLIEPDKGEVIVKNKALRDLLKENPREIRQHLQIVFQDPYNSLDPLMRAEDIILEGPCIMGIEKERRKKILEETLANVHLDFRSALKLPHQFSGGERQRIAIARALAVRPEFLVLDEPVSSLDVLIQQGVLELLKDLQEKFGLSYLFISHNLAVIEKMAHYVAVMKEGKIVEFGAAAEIYQNPRHPYTAKLVASMPKL